MNGFINLIKPVGMSSNQAVGIVKRSIGVKKVGHAGSLDPLACGVLPIMVGRATKLFDYTLLLGKKYICELEFGYMTDTLDTNGNIIETSQNIPSENQILKSLNSFIGNIKQIPPKYSALKINGKRMYDMARNNEEFVVSERDTCIYELKLLSYKDKKARFYIHCKSGFYVRSFCRDIALYLNSVATMTALVRVCAANLDIKNAISIEYLVNATRASDFSFILPIDSIFNNYDAVILNENERFRICNGLSIKKDFPNGKIIRVYYNDILLGFATSNNNYLKMSVHL